MALQIRRGTNKERLGITMVEGEIAYVTDSQLTTTTATTIASNLITTAVPHELAVTQKIKYISNSANGLTENTIYYVIADGWSSGTFKVSTTLNGTAVTLTNGSGLSLQFAVGPTLADGTPIGHSVSPVWAGDGITTGGLAAGAATLDELSDVSIGIDGLDGVVLDNNHMLQYNSTRNQWENRGNISIPGTLRVYSTAASTSKDTGAVIIEGGLGVEKSIFAGGAVDAATYVDAGTNVTAAANITAGFDITATNGYVFAGTSLQSAQGILYTTDTGTATVFNENATTLEIGGAATLVDIGAATGTTSINNSLAVDGNTTLGNTSGDSVTINAATVATPNGLNFDSDTLVIDAVNNWVGIGINPSAKLDINGSARVRGLTLTVDGDIAANGGDITTSATTFNLLNGGATTVNAFGAATNLTLGAAGGEAGGTTLIRNNTTVSGDFQVGDSAQLTVDAATGTVRVYGTAQASGQDSGALQVDGGAGINKNLWVGGEVEIDATTGSTSVDTGALRVDGGVGINENLYVGGLAVVAGTLQVDSGVTIFGDLTVNGTTTTINSTTLSVDDKNIEIGSVATPSDATANGGGITLKGTTDKTITWSSTSTRWESNIGFDSTAAKIGNIDIARSTNDNTITTSTGNLILDAASNTIQLDANVTHTGNTTQTGTLTNDGVTANDITIGIGGGANAATTVTTTAGGLYLDSAGTEGVNVLSFFGAAGDVELGTSSGNDININGLVDTDIEFKQQTTGLRGTRGTVGTNDYWFMGGSQTGTDQGYAVIATGDNGTEPVYVRQYTGLITGANTSYRQLKLLDESGNTVLPGSLTVDVNATVTGNLDVNGTFLDGVTLEQAFVFGYDENNDRVNRPTFKSTTGNTSGLRVQAPNATSSARAIVGVFNTNDSDNGKFLNFDARNTTNPLRIVTGQYTSGVGANTTESVAFTNFDGTVYASVNPAGTTNSTDLSTKTYTDGEVDKLQDGTYSFTTVNLNAIAGIRTVELVTSSATEQTLASLSATTYRSAKYQIQIESGTDYQAVEAVVVHNGTTASITVYGDVRTGADLADIAVTISGGNMLLRVTPVNAITTFRAVETAVKKA